MAGRPKSRARKQQEKLEQQTEQAAKDALERDERILVAAEMLLAGGDDDSIRRHARGIWLLDQAEQDQLIADARARVLEAAGGDRASIIQEHLAKRRMLYRRAVKAGQYSTASQLLKDEASMMGLYPREGAREPARAMPDWHRDDGAGEPG